MNATGIEYLDFTSNPIVGCDMSLPCAERCWARRMARRLRAQGKPQYQEVIDACGKWTGKTAFSEATLMELLRRRKPATTGLVFMGDAFHDSVPDEWLDRMLATVALTPHVRYILPTKRAKRMRKYFCALGARPGFNVVVSSGINRSILIPKVTRWPLPNLALMFSASRQKDLQEGMEDFLATPAAVHILSLEPLLGAIHLEPCLTRTQADVVDGYAPMAGIDWVIVGGESGPGARPMEVAWVRSARDQCIAADIPFMLKQWGRWMPTVTGGANLDNPRYYFDNLGQAYLSADKKSADRLLDGKLWDECPKGWGE